MKKNITAKEACTLAHQIKKTTGCTLAEAFKLAYSGQTESTPKTSWTADELNQIFSDKVAELLRKGYTIDLGSMSGHQGEIGKVTFKKGNDYYVLVMEDRSNFNAGKYDRLYTIRFGKYTEEVNQRPLDTWNTMWLEKYDNTWSLEFVRIADNYFVTVDQAEKINQLWRERTRNSKSSCFEEVGPKYTKAILGCVRKQKGFKGVKASEIAKVVRITPYNWVSETMGPRYYKVTLNRTNKYGNTVTVDIKF